MKTKILIFAAFLIFGPACGVFAGETAFSQLPGIDAPNAPLPPVMKADSSFIDFRVSQQGRSGFYLTDVARGIQINGYKDFDGNVRLSGLAGQESLFGSFERNFNAQDFTFEMGATKLQVKRYSIHYKVTGFAAGATGVLSPVNLLIRGGIRERRYEVSEAGLRLNASEESITGTVDAGVYEKKFVAAVVSIIASLQSDDVFCVVEKASNYPNPFVLNSGTMLTYTLLQPAEHVRVTVYNAYGKVIKELTGGGSKGVSKVFWDGRSEHDIDVMGRKIFFWQLEISLRGETEKVIKQFKLDAR